MKNRFSTAVAVALCCAVCASANASSKTRKSTPITRPKFIPTAQKVDLFKGMEEGQFTTKIIAKGPLGGNVLVTNNSDEPLTAMLPNAFVAVHVLKQFGAGAGGGGQQGGGFGQGGGQQGGGGGQQNAGGGFGGGQQGGGGGGQFGGQQGGGGGGNFFSIPPEKTVLVPYVSVCMEHGKNDPSPLAEYKMVKLDEYTQDPVLRELITMVGSGKLPPQAAQAAVWTKTDNMSWQQLASKVRYQAGRGKSPYFNPRDVRTAQMIVTAAEGRVREAKAKSGKADSGVPPVRANESRVR